MLRECLHSKAVDFRVYLGPRGNLWGALHNHSWEAVHLTPNMASFWFQPLISKLLTEEGSWQVIHSLNRMQVASVSGHILLGLAKAFPSVFQQEMGPLTPAMRKLTIREDQMIINPPMKWISLCSYQGISLCDEARVGRSCSSLCARGC